MAEGGVARLEPMTRVISKQLMPVYDSQMIHYSLSTLTLADTRAASLDMAMQSACSVSARSGASISPMPSSRSRVAWRTPILSALTTWATMLPASSSAKIFYGHGVIDVFASDCLS